MRLLGGASILILCYVSCLGETGTGGTLVQFPSHTCFQEDITFMCTRTTPYDSNQLISLVISVLYYPPFDTSRLTHSNAYTDTTAGTVNQNITLQAVTLSEAPALILCLSILWSNLTNSVVETRIESNANILIAPNPSAIERVAARVLNVSALSFTIEHEGVVHREDRLTYSISLAPVGTSGYPVYNVSYSDLSDMIFSTSGLLDTCYLLSVDISNCVGATDHFSTRFLLPQLRNDTLTRVSLTEFCWYSYGYNDTCPEPYGVDFTKLNTFSFLIILDSVTIDNVTSSQLMLPTQICFLLPEQHLAHYPLHLRIYMDGVELTTVDLSIPVRDPFPTPPVDIATIGKVLIIAVPSVVGLVLLSLFLLFVVVFLVYLVKRKKRHNHY